MAEENEPSAPLGRRIAALGDLHVKEEHNASTFRDLFSEISKEADVVALCGDLTDTGTVRQAEILAENLRSLTIPAVAVLGNHDYECGQVDQVKATLKAAGLKLLDGESCVIDDVGFVGAKGFAGGFGKRMLSSFGEPAIKQFVGEAVTEALHLENAMRSVKAQRSVVVLHYAPIAETVEGEPLEIYPFLGSSRLAETIDRFPVDLIVHGHAHRGRFQGRTPGGTPVYNVAYGIDKPNGKPYALLEV
jgi:Icc-related predicted phosphoesterase